MELYARLVLIASLDSLTQREKTRLLRQAKSAGYKLLETAARVQAKVRPQPPRDPRTRARKDAKVGARDRHAAMLHSPPPEPEEGIQAEYPPTRSEMRRLQEEMLQAAYVGRYVDLVRRREQGETLPTYWDALKAAHREARKLIPGLLNVGAVPMNLPGEVYKSWLVIEGKRTKNRKTKSEEIKDWKVAELRTGAKAEYEILFDLLQTINRDPFPFRRCQQCQTIFVRNRRAIYCSPQCRTDSENSAKNPKRREYARNRMRKKRRKGKVA